MLRTCDTRPRSQALIRSAGHRLDVLLETFPATERRASARRVGGDSLQSGRGGARRSNRVVHGRKAHSILEAAASDEPRSAGVPPAGSPGVSLGVGTGGETSPAPAAGDGRATLALAAWFCLLACVTASAAQPPAVPAWPPPPAAPYIVYVRELAAPQDIGAKAPFFTRLANTLTGVGSQTQKLSRPFGLSLDEVGNLLVTDTGANAVCYLDLGHKKWLRWTSAGDRKFLSPVAAVHRGSTFYVADSALGAVVAFDEKGRLQFEITNALARPAGLALQGDRLFIVDSELHQVVVCGLHGEFISKFGQRGSGPGEFNFPTHVAVDERRQIYVTDSLNNRIQVFTADGHFVRLFGSVGDGPGRFSRPKGVAVDHAGHVYVVDAVFGNVQIFNDQGRLLLDFGAGGSAAGQFWLPNAIAINARNEIYVADAYNHRVQEFRYTGRE